MVTGDAYLQDALIAIPRLLSLENRNPLSRTFGCFDRDHWQYAVVDTPSARCQEAALTLALLYQAEGPDTPWRQNPIVREWIEGALWFWTSIQARDGSFSEWYPNESSFVATAFTTYAATETLYRLRGELANAPQVLAAARRAGDWLVRHAERRVANQEAGAAAALWCLSRLTEEGRYRREAVRKIEQLVQEQTEEGWFPEYGGADIGYLSQLVAYLAKIYRMEPREDVHRMAAKAAHFLMHFAHPDGSFGGEYASRETSYFIPHAAEVFAPTMPAAAFLARRARIAVARGTIPSPRSLDDRYLSYTGYEYLFAYLDARPLPEEDEAAPGEFVEFSQAGLVVIQRPEVHLVVSTRKGGSLVCQWPLASACLLDPGIAVRLGDTYWKSAWLIPDRSCRVDSSVITSEGPMVRSKTQRISPASNLGLRVWQLTLGRSAGLSLWLKTALRDRLISKAAAGPFRHSREVRLQGSELEIIDRIAGPLPQEVVLSPILSSLYVPSSRFYQAREASQRTLRLTPDAWGGVSSSAGPLTVFRRYDGSGALVVLKASTTL
jgi:hypothetical protein